MRSAQPRDRIAQTVRSLAAEACDMEFRLAGNGDLVACVVGGASRIQELVIDLLATSRYINSSAQWEGEPATAQETAQVVGSR
jgi:hypothetical protein